MESTFGLRFYLRKPKKNGQVEFPIFIRITVDGTVKEISTKRKCTLAQWNRYAGRAYPRSAETKTLNKYLDTLQHKVYEAKRKCIELDKPVTAEGLRNAVLGIDQQARKTLLTVFHEHNNEMAALIGNGFADGTLERYKTSYRHTKNFIQSRYHVDDISLHDLDYTFLADYEFWLKTERKCSHNSAIKYLSNFRKIVNRCIKRGWISKDPFLGYSMKKTEVERRALTTEELEQIASKKFNIERLRVVRDIFLFSCYTGLAYIDVQQLRVNEIQKGVDGEQWIIRKRRKTNVSSRIPLLPVAMKLVERYEVDGSRGESDFAFPVLSNQKMNAYLKEIADVCGVKTNLTFHLARHTFATTITLTNGVPIETVSKMLGHKNLKTTQHYAKVLDMKISEDMKLLRAKYLT